MSIMYVLMYYNAGGEIIYPFPNFNGCNDAVWE